MRVIGIRGRNSLRMLKDLYWRFIYCHIINKWQIVNSTGRKKKWKFNYTIVYSKRCRKTIGRVIKLKIIEAVMRKMCRKNTCYRQYITKSAKVADTKQSSKFELLNIFVYVHWQLLTTVYMHWKLKLRFHWKTFLFVWFETKNSQTETIETENWIESRWSLNLAGRDITSKMVCLCDVFEWKACIHLRRLVHLTCLKPFVLHMMANVQHQKIKCIAIWIYC